MYKREIEIPSYIVGLEVIQEEVNESSYDSNAESPPNEQVNGEKIMLTPEELEAEIANAYTKGFNEGELKGYQKCENEYRPLVEKFNATVETLEDAQKEVMSALEQTTVQLAVKIAKHIINAELKLHPELLIQNIQRLVKLILDDTEITILLHPEVLSFVREHMDDIQKENTNIKKINLEPDKSVPVGSCLVETRSGILDTRIDALLMELERNLLEKMKKYESD
ncbi:MAG: hypothetical protein Kow00108_17150 [Calditrichia bacterium]